MTGHNMGFSLPLVFIMASILILYDMTHRTFFFQRLDNKTYMVNMPNNYLFGSFTNPVVMTYDLDIIKKIEYARCFNYTNSMKMKYANGFFDYTNSSQIMPLDFNHKCLPYSHKRSTFIMYLKTIIQIDHFIKIGFNNMYFTNEDFPVIIINRYFNKLYLVHYESNNKFIVSTLLHTYLFQSNKQFTQYFINEKELNKNMIL